MQESLGPYFVYRALKTSLPEEAGWATQTPGTEGEHLQPEDSGKPCAVEGEVRSGSGGREAGPGFLFRALQGSHRCYLLITSRCLKENCPRALFSDFSAHMRKASLGFIHGHYLASQRTAI